MTIHLATDHAGFKHKEAVAFWLKKEGYEVVDHGALIEDGSDDFPDFISKAAAAVNQNPDSSRGIIFGGSGQGEGMMANSYPRVRATVFYGGDENIPILSRQHNDSNVLSIGARFVDIDNCKRIIWEWLHTEAFTEEKYGRRNEKMEDITNSIVRSRNIPIVPAVIPSSEEEVINFSNRLTFSPEYHLDLIDGKFVPATSWPFVPNGNPMNVKPYLDRYTLEVDLMVQDPLPIAREWIKAGADMLVFHVETISLDAFKAFTEDTNISLGVSAHGDTTIDTLSSYAEFADYIQLMGIHQIGAQGLPFDENVLVKIAELKRRFPLKSITIDGSVNKDTIARLAAAGADRFICGSAIVKQEDPEAAHAELSALINE